MRDFEDGDYQPYRDLSASARRPSVALAVSTVAALALGVLLGVSGTMYAGQQRPLLEAGLANCNVELVGCPATTPAAGALPHKFGIQGVTPVQLQLNRGACWLFAIAGLLEQTYRTQGAANGWLKPNEYLKLSEQGLGASMLEACRAYPEECLGDDDSAYGGNSTEGGEVLWMWYMRRTGGVAQMAVPDSVCPWAPFPDRDASCSGMDTYRKVSPLHFVTKSLSTYYDRIDIKHALMSTGRQLALSTPLVQFPVHLPSSRAAAAADNAVCTACPNDPAYATVECCVSSPRFMTNMRGEFYIPKTRVVNLEPAGGHAVGIVGWSDTFRSEEGYTGGWLIKNSWWDGLPPPGSDCHDVTAPCKAGRGSHTMDFFLGKISDYDEAKLCPNVHSPRSWYRCASLSTCLKPTTAKFALATGKVLSLVCTDESIYAHGVCVPGEKLYLKSITAWGEGLSVVCAHRVDTANGDGEPLAVEVCAPPLPLDDVALIFGPASHEIRPNQHDVCGFYFYPYEVAETVSAQNAGWFVNDVEIEWPESAYAANSRGRDAGYELVRTSTKTQKVVDFSGPWPLLHEVA